MSVKGAEDGYFRRFIQSAWGGAVVGGALMAWTTFSLPGAAETAKALADFKKAVATPEPAILVPVLFISLVMLALSGLQWAKLPTRFLLRPALRFCSEFCATAAGAMAPFALVHLRSDPGASLITTFLGLVVAGSAGKVFDMALEVHEAAAEESSERWQINALAWIGLLGSVGMGLTWFFHRAAP